MKNTNEKYSYSGFKVMSMSGPVTVGVTIKLKAITEIKDIVIDAEIKKVLNKLFALQPKLVAANAKYKDYEAALRLMAILEDAKDQYIAITDLISAALKSKRDNILAAGQTANKYAKESATDLFAKGKLSKKLNNMLGKQALFANLTDEEKRLTNLTTYIEDYNTIADSYTSIYGTKVSDDYDENSEATVTEINDEMKALYKRLKDVINFVQGGDTPNNKFVKLLNDVWKKEATCDATSATAKKKAEDAAKAAAKAAEEEAAKGAENSNTKN